jgi:hypothetical protein
MKIVKWYENFSDIPAAMHMMNEKGYPIDKWYSPILYCLHVKNFHITHVEEVDNGIIVTFINNEVCIVYTNGVIFCNNCSIVFEKSLKKYRITRYINLLH